MTKAIPFKLGVAVTIFMLIFSAEAFSQIVTPSIDPSLPTEAPSAVSWRIGSAFGGSMGFAQDKSDIDESSYYTSETSFLMAYQPGSFVSELFWTPFSRANAWDSSTDALTGTTFSGAGFRIALRGETRVSVGIGYNTGTREEPVLGTSTKINNTSYEGSFSMRLLNNYFIAAGLRRNTDSYPTGQSIKSNITYGGAAAHYGDPLGTRFKSEFSVVTVPRAENVDLTSVFQPKTTITNFSLETGFGNYLLLYRYQSRLMSSFNTDGDDKKIVENRYGLGYSLGSLIFSVYGSRAIESVNSKSRQTEKLVATFCYSFI